MTCKDCIHYDVCHSRIAFMMDYDDINDTFVNDMENRCKNFKDKTKYIELPCIAMIEQHLVGGKFVNSSLQNWNGKYAVAYFDKKKSNILLMDICGKYPYNADEAQKRLKELQ